MTKEQSIHGRVLVMDRDNETSRLIKLILQTGGEFKVWRTEFPDEAISLILSEKIDLVLCEGFNESQPSLELCEKIQSGDAALQNTAIMFYADRHDQQSLLRAFEVGAIDYLLMPLYPMEFKTRVRSHVSLKQQKDLILKKMAEQKELIHIMCHDINGPVGVPLQLMKFARNQPDIILESLDSIINSLGKAIELTEMVRQLQAVEDGKKEWHLEPLNLKEAVEDSLSVYQERLDQKGVRFVNSIDPDTQVLVERVSFVNSVVSNLISNSIKFSTEGSEIEVSAQKGDDSVVFVLKDQGIGMPAKIQENLFNLGVPTSREGTHNEQGTGYGMPLVKKFVLSYGGEVRVSSKDISAYPDDHGTEFQIILKSG